MKSLLTLALLSCCLATSAADQPAEAKPKVSCACCSGKDDKKTETKCPGCACCAKPAEGKASDGHDHGAAAKPAEKEAKSHDHGAPAAKPADATKDVPAKPYPLKTCIVSDNDLDSMGEQASFVYQGQTIKVCCKACIAKFEKNPAKYLKKLEGK